MDAVNGEEPIVIRTDAEIKGELNEGAPAVSARVRRMVPDRLSMRMKSFPLHWYLLNAISPVMIRSF